MSDEVKSDKRRFFADLRKVEIVRNGKRMRWDENRESFVEIKGRSGEKKG
jgi:hypothetical protein